MHSLICYCGPRKVGHTYENNTHEHEYPTIKRGFLLLLYKLG